MKKNFLKLAFILATITTLLIGCSSSPTYSSLEEVVKSNIQTHELSILNVHKDYNLVLFLNHSQYILGTYSYKNGIYDYFSILSKMNKCNEDLTVRIDYIKDVGNIIWGTLESDQNVENFIIEYSNGERDVIIAQNNTFVSYVPEDLQEIHHARLITKVLNVFAVNDSDKIIGQLKLYNMADPIMVMAH